MSPIYFLRPKGALTIAYGLLLLVAPSWLISFMGGELGAAAEAMIRALSLPVIFLGYGMLTTPVDAELNGRELLLTIACELTASAVVLAAAIGGAFNIWGYILAAVYLFSASGFVYCLLASRRNA